MIMRDDVERTPEDSDIWRRRYTMAEMAEQFRHMNHIKTQNESRQNTRKHRIMIITLNRNFDKKQSEPLESENNKPQESWHHPLYG